MHLVRVDLVGNIRSVVMDLDELKLQVALGIISDEISEIVWTTADKEILKVLSDCTEISVRKSISVNPYTPYSILKKFLYDKDSIVRACAWDRISMRYKRRFGRAPVNPYPLLNQSNSFDDLPPDVLIYKQQSS